MNGVHPISRDVEWVKKRKSLVSHGKRIKGLLDVLKAVFYPKYKFDQAKLGPVSRITKQFKAYGDKKSKVKGSKRVGIGLGRAIGISLDLQKKYKLKRQCFFDPEEFKHALKKITMKTDLKNFKALFTRKVKYFQRFWELMDKMDWKPLAAEVPVRHPVIGIGTRADAVVYNKKTKKVKVLELKTGYESYYLKHTKFAMLAPFGSQSDAPFNQHQLQLAATHSMYKKTYTVMETEAPMVLRFHSGGIEMIAREEWAKTKTKEMFEAVQKDLYAKAQKAQSKANGKKKKG